MNTNDILMQNFYNVRNINQKLQIFQKITDYNIKLHLLSSIKEDDKRKFYPYISSMEILAQVLNNLKISDTNKSKTFRFVIKHFKGDYTKVLKLIENIDFKTSIPDDMLLMKIKNLNCLTPELNENIKEKITNYKGIKFKFIEKYASKRQRYYFIYFYRNGKNYKKNT